MEEKFLQILQVQSSKIADSLIEVPSNALLHYWFPSLLNVHHYLSVPIELLVDQVEIGVMICLNISFDALELVLELIFS